MGTTGIEQLNHSGVHQSQSHSQLSDTKWVWEKTLIRLVQDSPIPHLHVQLLNVIATKYY